MLGIYCRTSRETDIENSTISQQRIVGIKFAEEHKFEYELYEDEGKSGFKISDDDNDPFNNRPAFMNLINDIKERKIDKVWVWEHSRLSRNQYASAFIFNVFEKFNITLYENQKEFDLNDPQLKFTRQILDAVSEYERQLIVARTTRGLRKRIEEGKRSHQKLYGYRKDGKDETGHTVWVPDESQMENYKYIFKRYMEGATLRKLSFEVYDKYRIEKWGLVSYGHFLGRILRGYQYTGYQLTIEGNEIYKKFRKNEIDNIQILLDIKYWIKSVTYPVELISIEEWVQVCEKLQVRGRRLRIAMEKRILRASRDIATGLIQCSDCGHKYYYKEQKIHYKKNNTDWIYHSYYHQMFFNNRVCKQRPKSFSIEYIDEIFKIFYFYFYLVFDNTNDLIKESQRNIKQTQARLKENIRHTEKEIAVIEKRIQKFQKTLDSSAEETDIIKLLLRNINSSEEKLDGLNIELSKLKIDYELQNEKFNQTLLEMTYYDVKEKILDWFTKLNIEEQRNELIKVVKTCQIFTHYLIIDTGNIIFLFDINKHYVFDIKLLENLNKDEVYKLHFIKMKGKKEARKFNDKLIHDVNLERDSEIKLRVSEYLMKTYNIFYSLVDKTKLISFIPLAGIMSIELEKFENENTE
jgi:DNA invertase Pin-like site-specific DNA recombinase